MGTMSWTEAATAATGLKTGRLVGLTKDGKPLVEFEGNPDGPRVARVLDAARESLAQAPPGTEVLLSPDVSGQPIVLGVLHDVATVATAESAGADSRRHVRIDGRRLALEAHEELTLRCGEASITLRADGSLVIRGARLLSRASGTHAIKGATVKIN